MKADQATSIFREISIGLKASCVLIYAADEDEYSISVPKEGLSLEVHNLLVARGLRPVYIDELGSMWR